MKVKRRSNESQAKLKQSSKDVEPYVLTTLLNRARKLSEIEKKNHLKKTSEHKVINFLTLNRKKSDQNPLIV